MADAESTETEEMLRLEKPENDPPGRGSVPFELPESVVPIAPDFIQSIFHHKEPYQAVLLTPPKNDALSVFVWRIDGYEVYLVTDNTDEEWRQAAYYGAVEASESLIRRLNSETKEWSIRYIPHDAMEEIVETIEEERFWING